MASNLLPGTPFDGVGVPISNPPGAPLAITAGGVVFTDRSGTITVANTAQSLMAANTIRKGFRIQNQSTGDLWINDTGVAATIGQPALQIKAGGYLTSESWGCSQTSVSIVGATAGQSFHASEA